MERIDFVLTWVDGSDQLWRAEKQKWEGREIGAASESVEANADCRYRSDENMLRYWFRCVERFAPWVNRIHFITCGQKPAWLNEEHPKLNLVNHKDYIPAEYLPTFNSNAIELNIHRIADLAEHFALFNDDMFLLQPISPSYFFNNGNPVLTTDLRYPEYVSYNNWSRFLFNDYCVLNRHFNFKKQVWPNKRKWFNVSELGEKRVWRNFLCYLSNEAFPVGIYGHFIQPHLKSTLEELWELEHDVMDATCRHRFRSDDQVNQYLLCAWNQAQGNFYPVHENGRGKHMEVCQADLTRILDTIRESRVPQICINDSPINLDNDVCMDKISEVFETLLPTKSSFEK